MSSKSFDNATREWVQIRKKLYLQIKSDVQRLLVDSWKEFVPLEKRYAEELSQPWRSVSKLTMYEGLDDADIILMGDFHALQQSQRGHLRILREWPHPEKLILAVEFFQAKHQKFVDLFMKGKLAENAFLEKIGWEKSWGFPWEHYKPLIDWAKKHNVAVFGVNWGLWQTKMRSIKTRENFSSICIRKIHHRFPGQKIFVIYGDLHLSKAQLPASIRKQEGLKKTKIKRVFQNNESLYFRALHHGLESKIEHIQFKSGDFCVQSVPPWIKWQSYLLFLEKTFDRQIDEFEDDVDHTDHVAKLAQFLSEEFKVKLTGTHLAVYSADDTHIYTKIRQRLSKGEWKVVKKWITEQRTFYIPELESGYLGRVTVNHTATLAGEYLHAFLSGRKHIYLNGQKDFERQIWIQAMAYLGSKVINHKRKTNSIEDLRKSLLAGDSKEGNRKVLLLALHQKVREISFLTNGNLIPLQKNKIDNVVYADAARLLGAMLGEKIYVLYRHKKWNLKDLMDQMGLSLEDEKFRFIYYKVLNGIAKIKVS